MLWNKYLQCKLEIKKRAKKKTSAIQAGVF